MAVLLFKIQTQMMNSAGAVSKNQIKQRPTEIQHNVVAPRVPARPLDTNSDVQTSDFYRTIIDNNLFRPLGWRPPRPTEPYRLIGTIIRTDEKIGAQAILQTTHGNTTYTVTRGDTLDANTTVIDIQAKQVTLEKAGEQRTLKLNTTPWLK
jgi:nucleoid-associated protein YgaU